MDGRGFIAIVAGIVLLLAASPRAVAGDDFEAGIAGGGDAGTCGGDVDSDGVEDCVDNCPDQANADQLDTDGDDRGDACDDDDDDDGVADASDNCPATANAAQSDTDGDTDGDACDDDDDDDGILDAEDNCPLDDNSDQADGDMDSVGDVCDRDLGFTDDGGCGCATDGGGGSAGVIFLALALLGFRRRRGAGLFALLLVLLPAVASAEPEPDLIPEKNSIAVGAVLGVFVPDDDHEFYNPDNDQKPLNTAGIDLGLRIGYTPIEYLAFEAEMNMIPIGTDDGDGATLIGLRTQVVLQYPGRITPFIAVGGGTMGVLSGDTALGDDADAVAHLGIGAMVFLKPRLALRLDGRIIRGPKVEFMPPGGGGTNHFSVLFGAAWTFGKDKQTETEAVIAKPVPPPEPVDTDGDGIDDTKDGCPNIAETRNGFEDSDGCADEVPDADNDGNSDRADGCPNQAEDYDEFEDDDGCPDVDNDGDGVIDTADRCPIVAGSPEYNGCPIPDRDGDGIADRVDNCPDEAGTADNRGCVAKQLVVIEEHKLQIVDTIEFASNQARIQKRSHVLLDNVAAVLTAHPEIIEVEVLGHTDDTGEAEHNKDLSRRRAEAVVAYLVARGIDAGRLEAIGRGEQEPIADNTTREGRAANRRVEFITETEPSALEPKPDGADDGE